MQISLLAFGKLKTSGLRDTADYYLRIIKPWSRLEEQEIKPLPVPDKSPATRARIQEKESESLVRVINGSPFFLLDERGKALDTRDWAALLQSCRQQGFTRICFCVGSSLGFSPSLRKQARQALSLGPQTLSHELARVVLMEQIYRALSVINGHPYHNDG